MPPKQKQQLPTVNRTIEDRFEASEARLDALDAELEILKAELAKLKENEESRQFSKSTSSSKSSTIVKSEISVVDEEDVAFVESTGFMNLWGITYTHPKVFENSANMETLKNNGQIEKDNKWRKGCAAKGCTNTTQWYCKACNSECTSKKDLQAFCAGERTNHKYLHWKNEHKKSTVEVTEHLSDEEEIERTATKKRARRGGDDLSCTLTVAATTVTSKKKSHKN